MQRERGWVRKEEREKQAAYPLCYMRAPRKTGPAGTGAWFAEEWALGATLGGAQSRGPHLFRVGGASAAASDVILAKSKPGNLGRAERGVWVPRSQARWGGRRRPIGTRGWHVVLQVEMVPASLQRRCPSSPVDGHRRSFPVTFAAGQMSLLNTMTHFKHIEHTRKIDPVLF